jgi:hypothetical protein
MKYLAELSFEDMKKKIPLPLLDLDFIVINNYLSNLFNWTIGNFEIFEQL